jgi:hypothetical protein
VRRLFGLACSVSLLISLAQPAAAVVGNWHTPCDVLLVQYISSTSPAVTKAYAYSQYSGSVTCEEMWTTQWVEIFGTVYTYDAMDYRFGRTTYYVYSPNASGAYGNPSTRHHLNASNCQPCSAQVAAVGPGGGQTRYSVRY